MITVTAGIRNAQGGTTHVVIGTFDSLTAAQQFARVWRETNQPDALMVYSLS